MSDQDPEASHGVDSYGFRVVALRWTAYAWLICSAALMVSCAAGWGSVG